MATIDLTNVPDEGVAEIPLTINFGVFLTPFLPGYEGYSTVDLGSGVTRMRYPFGDAEFQVDVRNYQAGERDFGGGSGPQTILTGGTILAVRIIGERTQEAFDLNIAVAPLISDIQAYIDGSDPDGVQLIGAIYEQGWTLIGRNVDDVFSWPSYSSPDADPMGVIFSGGDRFEGLAGDDLLDMYGGDDTGVGGPGDDTIQGGDGQDTAVIAAASTAIAVAREAGGFRITSADGADLLQSVERFAFTDRTLTLAEIAAMVPNDPTEGDDVLIDAPGAQAFDGLGGTDTVDYAAATGRVLLDFLTDVSGAGYARFYDVGASEGDTYVNVENAIGGDFADNLRGDGADNRFEGGGVSDRLYGRGGDDTLDGGTGADALYGNLGADVMTGGPDAGRMDRYIYFGMAESGVGAGNRDIITDFVSGEDRIEIGRLDADITQGRKQSFDFVGDAGLSGAAGELAYAHQGGNTIVQADVDGDGAADFEIELAGIMHLTVDDFLI